MRTLPAGLVTHLAGDTWTIATLWVITREDSTIFRFTNHDTDLIVGGYTYVSAVGYFSSSIEYGVGGGPDNMENFGILDDAGIKESDLQGGLFDNAVVTIGVVNFKAVVDGAAVIFKGRMGEVSIDGEQFRTELRGLYQQLDRRIGELYTPSCAAVLGDSRCNVNMASFTATGTIPGSWFIDSVRFTFSDWESTRQRLYEMGVHATIGGADQATPASNASASDSYSTNTPNKAFDDDLGTYWENDNGDPTPWLRFDFDSPVTFAEYHFEKYSACCHANDWIVEVLQVGSSDWALVQTITDADWGDPPTDTAWSVIRTAGTKTGSKVQIFDPARNEADDHWKGGKVTWTSGPNSGLTMDIKQSFSTGRIILWEPMVYEIEVGDGYTMETGCDKTLTTCKTRYSNVINFRGFPHLKGVSEIIRGPQ